ncbi:alcohol dehydrogenase catalytic domain-containing protein [Acidianus sulfidivorans JP7]|uniref:Glucose 1-dehydrogenase n=1 Tax=Acidianus sulfidivorans JP7 TaxID=619593 RepID=A0A2U9IK63_9CREN|nr:glucose 1-dehydrogenase [Acidianus sulfidivorans]AWR96375.1 alcohol dehydrogenase catalytic domain-containing protein [Acidianus sulfidivorans JP7]
MKAIVIKPHIKGMEVKDINLEEKLGPSQVRIRTLYTGVCGTDRGLVGNKLSFVRPPEGWNELILGHEAFGIIEEVGEGVTEFKKGDYVVPVVRRGCGVCLNCKIGRQDFCETGNFVEAGIRGKHGFMREEFVDDEIYLVRVPESIKDVAVLTEPLSNVVKAIDEVMQVQRRMVWNCPDGAYDCRNAYVVGTGPIGTFFSILLRTYGFNVFMLNKREPSPAEDYVSKRINAQFIDTSKKENVEKLPKADIIVDTSGFPSAFLPLLSKINKNGILVLFGTQTGDKTSIDADLVTFMVENNIAIIGSVNANKMNFKESVNYLTMWKEKYGELLNRMITTVVPPEQANTILESKPKGEIKSIIKWS